MGRGRVLAIGLDGYEATLGDRWIVAGEMPRMARLREGSARFLLESGSAQRTGLAWEHLATGLSPDDARRWSAVDFDARRYAATQCGAKREPFAARLDARTVVFDPPYFDLARAPNVRGLVAWGAHDPGTAPCSQPGGILEEVEARFGPYPAKPWIYGFAWPSVDRTRAMGDALAEAVRVRADAAHWMLAERLPDWDLGLVVVSELHSAIEGLWHGVDEAHPLHGAPSAAAAKHGLLAVHREVDRLVTTLAAAFDDATLVLFSMGGMGPNNSDLPSMVLLPELLYRHAFGRPLLEVPPAWVDAGDGLVRLGPDDSWSCVVNDLLPPALTPAAKMSARLARLLPGSRGARASGAAPSLGWMPASRYARFWPRMDAFALPSFYDGRVRLNLQGREARGRLPLAAYEDTCEEIIALLEACRDPRSGEGVIQDVERPSTRDPRRLAPSEADLVIVWRGSADALEHPTLGRIGPLPFRRPGGHTGRHGMAWLHGPGQAPGDAGIRSAFDVAPTLVDLVGAAPLALSGRALSGADGPRG
jgi:hypothetical protein